MQIKLKAVKITHNEDGTVSTKLQPELIGGVEGSYTSGELFITVPNAELQPPTLTHGAELDSNLKPFVEAVEEPTI
ncbi:hypothetical protein [Desulforamulus hydrothermalis]|uniref:Uncharacterized protein n=1 Tax=Desulforamulus hydrothermalis Lam5 = DSM 18033 TaxID=1121428 RepID=K8DZA7_9FIRM|nr:hypothetical protein [Desulforamulus hydrothermalis]CCO08280.1 hypothetical protein DESHY_20149 [Desulforamulus hydrothermalis Lam5 = DSM 18033]SHH37581.1 hypothetical protein SAMN02745177_02346 [Desulforamulus hydrothermalis Lam5 = DSM 18033]